VVNGYQLAPVMALLHCAALGESLGLPRMFIIGVALFTVGDARSTGPAPRSMCWASPPLPSTMGRMTTTLVLAATLLAVAVISSAALVRRQIPRSALRVPLDLLPAGPFRVSMVASVCCFDGQMASYVALPFYLQHVLGRAIWPLALP
jgi:hypothetical protein